MSSETDEGSSLRNIRPGVVAEVIKVNNEESTITRVAPEIAQSIIPVIQTESPFPQIMIASSETTSFMSPKKPSQPTAPFHGTIHEASNSSNDASTSRRESQSAEPAILKSGWLTLKRRHFFRTKWIHRYFILRSDSYLYQYKNDMKNLSEYQFAHVLSSYCRLELVDEKEGRFDLNTPKHAYHFKVSSPEELRSWIETLGHLRNVWKSEE